jgi:hypothetical protein
LKYSKVIVAALIGLLTAVSARAEVKVVVDHNDENTSTPAFKFKTVPPPSTNDAAARARISVVDGVRDAAGGEIGTLNDGELPDEPDAPKSNFFFDAGTDGGRIVVDLGRAIDVKQINTYSWHPTARGPQCYRLFASDGGGGNRFIAAPKNGINPARAGWKLIAEIDTRDKPPETGVGGGQYGVSIVDTTGTLGKFRYLLLDVYSTEDQDNYGNTFFSEIDVIDDNARSTTLAAASGAASTQPILLEGKYVTVDVTAAPDLKDWARDKLLPTCDEWYPIIVKMLPSDGYTAADRLTVQFRKDLRAGIPAMARGTQVSCNVQWFRRNLDGEAVGAVVHELVHVVQRYGQARRNNPDAARNPGWMVEGIADYIRWFKYEPQTRGAEIRNPANAKYDASYRVTANFLNWVTEKYDKELVAKMNAAMREGKYSDDLWKQFTGKSADELGKEWKESLSASAGGASTRPSSS